MGTYRLDKLFQPASVALIGASKRPYSVGNTMAKNLIAGGFKGRLHFTNPKGGEVEGLACLRGVEQLPDAPDLAIVAAPTAAVRGVVRELAEKGTKTCVVVSGARELGEEAVEAFRDDLEAIVRPSGMRLVGPDCLGVMVPRIGLNASYAAEQPKAGDIALVSQSATVVSTVIDWANQHGVGFSSIVTIGDKADVDFADVLDVLAQDYRTRAILLYVEDVTRPQKFMSAARAAARSKPVVLMKSGRHREVPRTGSHARKLAGADAVYDAAFRRAGILRVHDLSEMFDAAETLSRLKPFPGKRLGVIANGIGAGILAVDRVDARGGKLATLSEATIASLDAVMPACWSGENPVDVIGDADGNRYKAAVSAVLADPGVDAVLVVHCPSALADPTEAAQGIADAVSEHRKKIMRPKPVFAAWLANHDEATDILDKAGMPVYRTPHDAVDGFMHLVSYSEAQISLMETPPSLPDRFEPDVDAARKEVREALANGRRRLDPVAVGRVLAAYRIPVAQAELAETPEGAAAIARVFIAEGNPCVIKVASEDIPHKTDVGGVRLNLTTPQAVEDATWGMLARIRRDVPDARIEGVTVHPMVRRADAIELFAGITEDPIFGPVVVFGRGGTAVEVINDKALALPPLDMGLAHDLIGRTRVKKRLEGYRDRAPADLDAVALTLVKLSQLSADIPEIREIDLNPLLADANGIICVDAKIEVEACPQARGIHRNPRFAVHPYPTEWERHDILKDGTRIFVRPVKPEDESLYVEFFKHVTAEDLRLRFFAPVKDFSHAFIAKLTQIDYARAIAFAAINEETGELLGVVRLHSDANMEAGEYAILLRSNLKGIGLGWRLMKRMLEYARAEGMKHVEGQVLRENTTMLGMCQRLGFSVTEDPDDNSIKKVVFDLEAPIGHHIAAE